MARQRVKFNLNSSLIENNNTEEKEVVETNNTTENTVVENLTEEIKEEVSTEEEDKPFFTKMIEELENTNYRAFDSKLIPRTKILLNDKNSYDQEKIESLAKTILYHRLQHNLSVIYDLESDTYTLESGERRCRAIDLLLEKFKDFNITDESSEEEIKEYNLYVKNVKMFEKGYPVNVQRKSGDDEDDEIESEIRLIIANEEVRDHNPSKTLEHINRLHELYSKKNEGVSSTEKINVNKTIADKLNVSDRQVMNYKKLNNLIPELQEAFKENNITITEGTNYASLDEEEQKQIAEMVLDGKSKAEIKKLTEELTKANKEAKEKEKVITDLIEEKDKVMNELEKEKTSNAAKIENLRETIKSELEAENPDKEIIESLEAKLTKAIDEQEKIKQQALKVEAEISKKENKIAVLEEEIKNLKANAEKPALKFDSTIKELISEEIAVKNKLADCYKEISSLVNTVKNYEKKYSDEKATELNLIDPAAIREEIERLIKKLSI